MVGISSDKGMVRSINEDYADYLENDKYKIYVVADGMGGHNAGEVASKLAVDSIIKYVQDGDIDDTSLEKAILYANKQIFDMSIKEESCGGMGTTVTVCLIYDNKIRVANVGDSCCFGIKDKTITKITRDHSLVQELIDSGSLTEEEGINHPKKNVITRALGTKENVAVDIFELDRNEYKIFLLCSDGLTNEISKTKALSVILESESFQEASDELIYLAKEQGGRDNITVLLFGGEV